MSKEASQHDYRLFSIKEAAKFTGISVSTLRNWERSGLIHPKRRNNNYRVFDFHDLELLKRIREYSQDKGLNQSIIKEMLSRDEHHTPLEKEMEYPHYHYETLKRYRKKMGYTLSDVAKAIHISPSYLSRVEQGKVNASYKIIEKLAAFFDESAIRFFDVQRKKPATEVVQYEHGQSLPSSLTGVYMEMQTTIKSQPFEVVRFVIEPNCGDLKKHQHNSGHDYITVLTGQLQVILDESKEFILKEKDSINFESTRIHQWLNPGDIPAEILWVHSYI
ncbi:DNA-binding transcriptional regulator, MerR family [Tindallia magadiensis]|uniref:DNA-binding transcriptional regulator, MerR family n=1 Tax=Tindallia magadiensis TaxID=69895 RepID=A0A1I3CUA9_9FIRM|nr:helix-turn-helix domain-containing protein [Tindallia magadiensis]SFH78023.1 DNA-binding transcriptional regulator, MerR family [Tindallia magadiensis]